MSYSSFYHHRIPALVKQIRKIKKYNPPKYFAVAVGRRVGIYRSWPSCKVQIDGILNARYRRFDDHLSALKYLAESPREIPLPIQDYRKLPGEVREDVVYVDGACWKNGTPDAMASIGVHWPRTPELDQSRCIGGRQTSIRAELHAAIVALEMAKARGVCQLTVFTDSQFVIQCATRWLWLWKHNGWRTSDGAPVKNQDDLQLLDKAINALDKVIWRPVPAHSGVPGNEEAHRLASSAIARHRNSIEQQENSLPPNDSTLNS